jgi:hypothetical protein
MSLSLASRNISTRLACACRVTLVRHSCSIRKSAVFLASSMSSSCLWKRTHVEPGARRDVLHQSFDRDVDAQIVQHARAHVGHDPPHGCRAVFDAALHAIDRVEMDGRLWQCRRIQSASS